MLHLPPKYRQFAARTDPGFCSQDMPSPFKDLSGSIFCFIQIVFRLKHTQLHCVLRNSAFYFFKNILQLLTILTLHFVTVTAYFLKFSVTSIAQCKDPTVIAARVCQILVCWTLAPELPISVPMLCADPHFAMTESSSSNRPALAKISSHSVTISFDKWIKQRLLSIESVLWGKLNKPETPRESPNEVSEERDWKQDFLWRIPLQEFSVINPKQTSTERDIWITANKITHFTI